MCNQSINYCPFSVVFNNLVCLCIYYCTNAGMSDTDYAEESNSNLAEESSRLSFSNDHQHILREFVEEYKNQRLLWDPQHDFFNNKYQRNIALDILVNVLKKSYPNATQHTARKQINSLRTNYRKERKKWGDFKGSMQDGEKRFGRRSWRFHALRFLDEITPVTPGKSESNCTYESIESDNESYLKSEMITYNTTSSRKRPRQQELEDPSENEDPFETTVPDAEYEYLEVPGTITNEEFDIIGRSVSLKLRRMTNTQRNHAEWLIHKVLSSGLNRLLNTDTDLTNLSQEVDSESYSPPDNNQDGDVMKIEN